MISNFILIVVNWFKKISSILTHDDCAHLQCQLNKTVSWPELNNLQPNIFKCKVMLFKRKLKTILFNYIFSYISKIIRDVYLKRMHSIDLYKLNLKRVVLLDISFKRKFFFLYLQKHFRYLIPSLLKWKVKKSLIL